MAGDYEEKYMVLRDENTALKKKKNEQEATIKRMFTKLAIIEEALKKKRLTEETPSAAAPGDNQSDPDTGGNKASGSVLPIRRDVDTEKFIQVLRSENTALRKQNKSLIEKNRRLQDKLDHTRALKGLPPTASVAAIQKRPASAGSKSKAVSQRISIGDENTGFADGSISRQVDGARKLLRSTFSGQLEVALKSRLLLAEKQLVKLQKENELLRANNQDRDKRRGNNNADTDSDTSEGDESATDETVKVSKVEMEQLRRKLKDRQAQMAILNARYENLESNTLAEREIQEKTLIQMEQMNRQLHKLRTQLQDAQMEKEEAEIKLGKSAELDKEVELLRDQNRRLEARMTTLCESPFINDAFQRKERIDRLFDLEKMTQEQKETIARMTEESLKAQHMIKELQNSVKQIKHTKDGVESELQRVKHLLTEERSAKSAASIHGAVQSEIEVRPAVSVAPPKPSPQPIVITVPTSQPVLRDAASSPVHSSQPSPPHHLPVQGSTTFVTRKYEDLLTPLPDLLDPATQDGQNVKHLRNRVHMLQIAHLKAIQELERCEKMLHAQTDINRELTVEIEHLTTQNVSASSALQKRLRDLELLCEDRQKLIQRLEAEIRQLKYARSQANTNFRHGDNEVASDVDSDDDADTASISESLLFAAQDLAPGEQLIELWVRKGQFDRQIVDDNSSTFVLCDFYEFESQATTLLTGSRPEYNLSTTFKVTVDAFFLRYLATESLTLEVHQSVRGDFRVVGSASVRLAKLLRSSGSIKEAALPVKLVNPAQSGGGTSILGTLSIVLRLSTALSEIWRLHLQSFPQDAHLLTPTDKATAGLVLDDQSILARSKADMETEDSRLNELHVTVFACRNLHAVRGVAGMRCPSSYVHYQLLGFPDIFTNIVPHAACPEYDLACSRQTFSLDVDSGLLRFFSKFCLWFTVFDDQAELERNNHDDGMIGKCGVHLADLVNGDTIKGWYPLVDHNEQSVGEISLLIEWANPFKILAAGAIRQSRGMHDRAVDLHTLDLDQQHWVLQTFSSNINGRINYRQFLIYALPSEELELLVSKIKERVEALLEQRQAQIQSVEDLLRTPGQKGGVSMDSTLTIRDLTALLTRCNITLSESELGCLRAAFESQPAATLKSAPSQDSAKLMSKYLLLHINPRMSCRDRLLRHKLRHTLTAYAQRQGKGQRGAQLSPTQLFERFDEHRSGCISRAEFRRTLAILGFDLQNVDLAFFDAANLQAKNARPTLDMDRAAKDSVASPKQPEVAKTPIDMDEGLVTEEDIKNIAVKAKSTDAARSELSKSSNIRLSESRTASTTTAVAATSAAAEFQRRKQAFTDRMKAIASSSNKSLVYERIEKKRQQSMQTPIGTGAPASRARPDLTAIDERLMRFNQQQAAAAKLQKQYRLYRSNDQRGKSARGRSPHYNVRQPKAIESELRSAKSTTQRTNETINRPNKASSMRTPIVPVAHAKREAKELNEEDKKRLRTALEAAANTSRAEFQLAFARFQEFCVVHRFGQVPAPTLWQEMNSNRFVEILSAQYIALLTEMFLTQPITEGSRSPVQATVMLKGVHAYLKTFVPPATTRPNTASPRNVARKPVVSAVHPIDSSGSVAIENLAVQITRQLVEWCEVQGINYRGEFEQCDREYSGTVNAVEFKQVLLRLGLKQFVPSSTTPEAVIGQLVREYRVSVQKDSVRYVLMLNRATQLPAWGFGKTSSQELIQYFTMSEVFRARARHRGKFVGKIDQRAPGVHAKLDSCFNHFDHEKKGFLTLTDLQTGLQALQIEQTSDQLKFFMSRMCVFRHNGGGLSRMEFDAFILEPYAFRVLHRMAQQMFDQTIEAKRSDVPRVAKLAHSFMENDATAHEGALPNDVFFSVLGNALGRTVLDTERSTLEHLFDVKRNGNLAYKLFLKVISQWHHPSSTRIEKTPGSLPKQSIIDQSAAMHPARQSPISKTATYPLEDLLSSLYNQLSSIDFIAQIEILEEHLESKDDKRSGCIKTKHLKRVFDQVGLSLTVDGYESLEIYFAYKASSEHDTTADGALSYRGLLKAIKRLHKKSTDKANRK